MFVITADQVDSRKNADLVAATITELTAAPITPVLVAERTVGDELQILVANGNDALTVILYLTRTGQWSVGCGTGDVSSPLPDNIREATGGAFIAARRAVERAKKRQSKFALETEPETTQASDAEALIDLFLTLRARRTPEGWELFDLLEGTDLTQAAAAEQLGISPQAVSLRARAAELRIEDAAREPLTRILDNLDNVENATREGRA